MHSLPHYDPGASLRIDLNDLEVTWQRNVPRQARVLVDPTRCPLIEAAYHEAGHAAVALAVGIRFTYVSILPYRQSRGHICLVPPIDPRDQLTALLAGLCGVVMGLGVPATWRIDAHGDEFGMGAADDYLSAYALLDRLSDSELAALIASLPAVSAGLAKPPTSRRTAARDRAILAAGIRAHQILKEPAVSRGMEAIAGALLRRQWLPYVAARAVYGAAADLGV